MERKVKMSWHERGRKICKWDIELSIVIPVKDEGENVFLLAQEINSVMDQSAISWECIWVDDGSKDCTLSELKKINDKKEEHQFIVLSQNYGQSAALAVGFRYARGKIIVTLDGDGQNDPHDIPMLMKRLLETKADMVNGWRKDRRDNLIRRTSSRLANGFRNWVTRENIRDIGCSMRIFKHQCVENIPLFKGMHRFLPTLVKMNGFPKIIEIPVNHRSRKYGQTKYGLHNRLWVGLLDTLAVRWLQYRMVCPKIDFTSFHDFPHRRGNSDRNF